MRLAIPALIALLIFSAPLLLSTSAQPLEEVIIKVERVIEPTYGGLLYIIDEIYDHGGKSFRYGIPTSMMEKLESINVEGADVEPLGEAFTGVFLYRLKPASEVVKVYTTYSGLISYNEGRVFSIRLVPEPFIDGKTYESSVVFKASPDVSYPASQNGWEARDIGLVREGIVSKGDKPSDPKVFRFTSDSFALVNIDKLSYIYDLVGDVVIIEIHVRNMATNELRELRLNLPIGSDVVEVYDNVGKLSYSYDDGSGVIKIDLQRSRYALQHSWRYSFKIKAKANTLLEFAKVVGDEVEVRPTRLINATISRVSVGFILPNGYEGSVGDEGLKTKYRTPDGRLVIELREEPASEALNKAFSISISKVAEPPSLLGLIFLVSGFVFLATGAVVYRISSQRAVMADELEAMRGYLGALLEDVDKLSSTVEELDGLVSPKRGKVGQAVINEKVQAIRRLRNRINEQVMKVQGRSQMVRRNISEISNAALELYEICKTVSKSYLDMSSGKISKTSYSKIYEAFKKDVRRELIRLSDNASEIREMTSSR